jgi:hypothetical protein
MHVHMQYVEISNIEYTYMCHVPKLDRMVRKRLSMVFTNGSDRHARVQILSHVM